MYRPDAYTSDWRKAVDTLKEDSINTLRKYAPDTYQKVSKQYLARAQEEADWPYLRRLIQLFQPPKCCASPEHAIRVNHLGCLIQNLQFGPTGSQGGRADSLDLLFLARKRPLVLRYLLETHHPCLGERKCLDGLKAVQVNHFPCLLRHLGPKKDLLCVIYSELIELNRLEMFSRLLTSRTPSRMNGWWMCHVTILYGRVEMLAVIGQTWPDLLAEEVLRWTKDARDLRQPEILRYLVQSSLSVPASALQYLRVHDFLEWWKRWIAASVFLRRWMRRFLIRYHAPSGLGFARTKQHFQLLRGTK